MAMRREWFDNKKIALFLGGGLYRHNKKQGNIVIFYHNKALMLVKTCYKKRINGKKDGVDNGTRTHDLRNHNPAL